MNNRRTTHSVRRVIALTALTASLFGATGCFGTFTTLQRLYHWNQTVEANKFARWGIFMATIIVPVYPSATIFDLIFTNTVEFWTGQNPMASNDVQTPDGDKISMKLRDDGAVDVAIHSPSQPDVNLVVRDEGDSVAAYDQNGALVARGVQLPR